MGAPNFWREVHFCQHRGLYQGNRVNVLEHIPHVLTIKRCHTSCLVI